MKLILQVQAANDQPMISTWGDDGNPKIDWQKVKQVLGQWIESIDKIPGAKISGGRAGILTPRRNTPRLALPGDPGFNDGKES